MNLLGCLGVMFIAICVTAFVVMAAFWLVIGSIMLLFKLLVMLAYMGGFIVVIAIMALIAALIQR